LISTVFIHMLQEVRESLEEATRMGILPEDSEFPFAEFTICVGFLLILLIESGVHKIFGGHGHSHFPSQDSLAKKLTSQGSEESVVGHNNVTYCVNRDQSTEEQSKAHSEDSLADKKTSFLTSLRSFFLVLALSIHSIFEGMAIGLDKEESGVWKLFLAITIHAIPIVFCIGTEMISSGVKKARILVYMIVLSITTPVGVLIGIIVTLHVEDDAGNHIFVVGVLQGLAGGTLLYISFFEVLARDKLSKYGMSGLLGAFAVLLGFLAMAASEAGGHSHSHGNHGVPHSCEVAHHGHSHHHCPPHPEFQKEEDGHDDHDEHNHGGRHNDHEHENSHNEHDHHHEDGHDGHDDENNEHNHGGRHNDHEHIEHDHHHGEGHHEHDHIHNHDELQHVHHDEENHEEGPQEHDDKNGPKEHNHEHEHHYKNENHHHDHEHDDHEHEEDDHDENHHNEQEEDYHEHEHDDHEHEEDDHDENHHHEHEEDHHDHNKEGTHEEHDHDSDPKLHEEESHLDHDHKHHDHKHSQENNHGNATKIL